MSVGLGDDECSLVRTCGGDLNAFASDVSAFCDTVGFSSSNGLLAAGRGRFLARAVFLIGGLRIKLNAEGVSVEALRFFAFLLVFAGAGFASSGDVCGDGVSGGSFIGVSGERRDDGAGLADGEDVLEGEEGGVCVDCSDGISWRGINASDDAADDGADKTTDDGDGSLYGC